MRSPNEAAAAVGGTVRLSRIGRSWPAAEPIRVRLRFPGERMGMLRRSAQTGVRGFNRNAVV
jgi:hypothetical protein